MSVAVTNTDYLLKSLIEVEEEDREFVGSKAYYLARVSSAGASVPSGFVLGMPRQFSKEQFDLTSLSERVQQKWGANGVAVRSSTAWEEGERNSWAGLFKSELNCRTAREIEGAIWRVLDQACEVAQSRGLEGERIGILLQPMIQGEWSGVCFTSHLGDLVLEYVEGDCSRVVEGAEGSQRRHFSHGDLERFSEGTEESVLDRVAATCWQLRQELGLDLDIEWTVPADGEVVILQARPITTLDTSEASKDLWEEECRRLATETLPGDTLTSMSIGEVFGRSKPLFADLVREGLSSPGPLSSVFSKLGFSYKPSNCPVFVLFASRTFINLSAYARSLGLRIRFGLSKDRSKLSWSVRPWSLRTVWRLMRFLRRFSGSRRQYLQTVDQRLEAVKSVEQLGQDWGSAKATLWKDFVPVHLEADVISGVHQSLVMKALSWVCGGEKKALRVMESLTYGCTNPNVETNQDLQRLGEGDISWEEFVLRQGSRGQPDWDLSAKRFRETESKVRRMAQRVAQAERKPLQQEKRRQRRSRLLEHFLAKRWWYRRLRPSLEANARLVYYREKTQHLLYWQVDQMRQLVLRQAEQSGFDPELAFFLHLEELESLTGREDELFELAKERQKKHRLKASLSTPLNFYARDPNPCSDEVLQDSRVMQGLGISQGDYEGIAFVAEGLEDALDMPEGGVLIFRQMDPSWSSVLCHAGAVLCEQGGLFAHSSLLIREAGLPAVVAIPGLCERVRSGDRVRVNGNEGWVQLPEN